MTSPGFDRILVAVDDSLAALAAVRVAIGLATTTGARLRFVSVISDGVLARALTTARAGAPAEERLVSAAEAVLRHVSAEAGRAGVPAETACLQGQPAAVLLDQGKEWGADLIVIGRSDVRAPGRAYVGNVTRHVLELAERPVLVVPRPA
jgi:nucleotide-binding universal stress UspA family protein